jgi:DNA-binding NarL/FixJ family response regulator
MKSLERCVLVLNQQPDDLQMLESLLECLRCPIVVASSAEQAMDRASQTHPYLVILVGNCQTWSRTLVSQLRSINKPGNTTIVALTDCHAPSWLHQEDNPGLDGFLVKPLSGDVLISLIQSAWARQACYSPNGAVLS